MKQPILPLELKDSREIIDGHYELTTLLARFYLFGDGPYQGNESTVMVARFLEMAPYKGAALYDLYRASGKPFWQFVSDVNNGMYFWQAVGTSLVCLFEIPLHLSQIAMRHVNRSIASPFNEITPIHSE